MAAPVTPEKRARAVELMREGMGRNAIARELEISGAAVTRLAHEAGHVFDWAATELATRARQVELGAMRTELAKAALIRASEALESMSAPHEEVTWQPGTANQDGGWQTYIHDEPSASDKRNYATIFGILTQRAADLMRSTDGGGVSGQAASVLDGLSSGLAAVAEQLREIDPGSDPSADPAKVSREDMIADLEQRIAENGEETDDVVAE